MRKGLKDYFPMIREREEVLEKINSQDELRYLYNSWNTKMQDEFLDYCTGVRGIKLLYDAFFKEIFNPDIVPERLEKLLSLILRQKVKILKVLPNDSARISAESSLTILDVVVELEDRSIANVEAQKIGYTFPGQRSACYSADLLLRQYKRVKGEKGKDFKYQDIKKVYTIIFFEKSSKEFHRKEYVDKEIYIHRSRQQTSTGLNIDLLQEYVFIALDIFGIKLDNKGVGDNNLLEAWMTCLCSDNPVIVAELIEKYPEFRSIYEEVYEMCRNLENVMGLFSKELLELDKNTVKYMIEEQQAEIDEMKKRLLENQREIWEKTEELLEQEQEIESQNAKLAEQEEEIRRLRKKLAALKL